MSAARLAALLIGARISGRRIISLAPELCPGAEDDAYQVQELVAAKLGVKLSGWKVGAPGPQSPPSCAPLFAGYVVKSPAHLLASRSGLNGVEAEIALRLGRDLPTRGRPYDEDEAWDAVESLHPAIEYLDTRFADRKSVPELALLADNLSNGGFCYGPPAADWRAIDLLQPEATLLVGGREAAHAVGGNAAGHPRRLLAWLANHVAKRGGMLKAGDYVTTGTHTGLVIAPPGVPVVARFAGIGESQLTLAAA
jgi:2-keto-4-pentenoate hydratase